MKRRLLILTPLIIACGPFFYLAPPPLENYLQRTPGKTWREVFAEARPRSAEALAEASLVRSCVALVAEFSQLAAADRLAKIDGLLATNRDGDFSYQVANFLHELRELAVDPAALAVAGPYLDWRVQQPNLSIGFPSVRPVRRWDDTDAQFGEKIARYEAEAAVTRQWFDDALAGSTPAFRPYLLVQRAALELQAREFALAVEHFDAIVADYPEHSRAEVARFMSGRCLYEEARFEMRAAEGKATEDRRIASLFSDAWHRFTAYLEAHPEGRFVGDAWGWLGGVAESQGDFGGAIDWQLKRLGFRPSREVMRSVLRECDQIIVRMLQDTESARRSEYRVATVPWKAIAEQPEVARLFVFRALDPAAGDEIPALDRNIEGDRSTLAYLHLRNVRPGEFVERALSQLARAVAAARGPDRPDGFTLGVLARSAHRNGDTDQALVLYDLALRDGRSDELLQGRALALAAAGRHREAVGAYQELARDFPGSPLARSSDFPAAISRLHAGEAGEALLMLFPLNGQGRYDPGSARNLEFEVIQWIDTIAQFAPLDQLAAPLGRLPESDPNARLLRAIVRTRAFCAEDFDLARRYLDVAAEPGESGERGSLHPPRDIGLNADRWQREIESLAGATEFLADSPPDQKARRHLQIGRRWQELRGRLTLPLHHLFDYSQSESEKLEQLRRKNAAFLGFPPEFISAELDSRDELQHALRHFLAAAESSDPDIAAPALEEANEALFRLAEFSLYRASRAVETDASGQSRQIVERLRRDFPERPEATRAATWAFDPPILLRAWMPGDYNPSNSAELIRTSITNPTVWWSLHTWYESPDKAESDRLWAAFGKILDHPAESMPDLRDQLTAFQADFTHTRPMLGEDAILRLVDLLDDLISVSGASGMTPDLFVRYATVRRGRGETPAATGEWEVLAPWLEFLDRIRPVSVAGSYFERPKDDTIASWQRYLAEYPDGPKSEAASLRLLRLQVRAVIPIPQVQAFRFPDAPIPGGYKRLTPLPTVDAETLSELASAITAHETRFPDGRYTADLFTCRILSVPFHGISQMLWPSLFIPGIG